MKFEIISENKNSSNHNQYKSHECCSLQAKMHSDITTIFS